MQKILLWSILALCLAVISACHRPFQKSEDFIGTLTVISGEHIVYYVLCPDGIALKPKKLEPGYELGAWNLQDEGISYQARQRCECADTTCEKVKPACNSVQDTSFILVDSRVFASWQKEGAQKPAGERPGMEVGEGTMYSLDKPQGGLPRQCAKAFQPVDVKDLEPGF